MRGPSVIEREADMLKLFCIPGRLLAKLFSREKKRAYRSIRSKPSYGPGMILISLVGWLALAGGILFAVDKAGLLNKALDVGVEVAQGGGDQDEAPPADPGANPEPTSPTTTGSATGELSGEGQSPTGLPPAASGGEGAATGINKTPVAAAEQWLVILHSIPKSARDEAERRKTRYRNQGLEVDVLDSDAFPLITSGSWWIVALGPFDDKTKALAAANRAKQFNSELMVRRGM